MAQTNRSENVAESNVNNSLLRELPKVSIIIVNYNGFRWLKQCIQSIVDTNYPALEMIIVDNGSTDQSLDYLKNHWRRYIRLIELKENLGFAEGCNTGIREANGDIIALLNNDIEVDRDWIKTAVQALLTDESVGAVQSKMMRYDDRKKIDCAGFSVDRVGLCIPFGFGEQDR